MKRLILASAILLALLPMVACADAERAHAMAWGGKQHVQLFSGGQKVGDWISSGQVFNEKASDGYYFMDQATGRLVRVSGTVVIERM